MNSTLYSEHASRRAGAPRHGVLAASPVRFAFATALATSICGNALSPSRSGTSALGSQLLAVSRMLTPFFSAFPYISRVSPLSTAFTLFDRGGRGRPPWLGGASHRFTTHAFSSDYKPLFPQLLCFLIYAKPWGWGGRAPTFGLSDLAASRPSHFPTLTRHLLFRNSRPTMKMQPHSRNGGGSV